MSRTDESYVHDPDASAEADADARDSSAGERAAVGHSAPAGAAGGDRTFDWRGWVLVGVIVFAFVVCPIAILLWPPDLHYFVALLILPLAPAFLLGTVAVWATARA